MNKKFDFIVIGGGIVGLAVAYKLSLKFKSKSVLVLEKEKKLSKHQTGRNSGVIHSGIYYKPGSLKARNCIDGRKQLVDFAKKNNVKFEMCGKLIVANNSSELSVLDQLFENGKKNGLKHIKKLNQSESRKYEPNIKCLESIFVPYAGIINYTHFTEKLAEKFLGQNSKNKVIKSSKVTGIENIGNKKIIRTSHSHYSSDCAIFAAGLYSDELAKMDNIKHDIRIIGFRGDYYNLKESAVSKVNALIYPVPNIELPFLGVHLTKTIEGGVEAGPNAVFSFKKEGYSIYSFSLVDTIKALSFIGLWKMFIDYWKIGLNEYIRAFSKTLFLNSLQKLVPALKKSELSRSKSGVRAQAIDKNGNLVDDFLILEGKNSIHIINAPSPAATSCLSIADHVINKINNSL